MKKLIEKIFFSKPRTEDVEQGNFLYEGADYSRAGKTTIPGDIPFDQWMNGKWSEYNHPECKIKHLKIA